MIRKGNNLCLILIIGLLNFSCETSPAESSANEVKDKFRPPSQTVVGEEMQNGDLIFHTSKSSQSQAIQIATGSKYSHVGILYEKNKVFYVLEAVQPVKLTKLETWIKRGAQGKYVIKRLRNSQEVLTEEGIKKMKSVGEKYLGKDYDLRFEWSDDKIYCSELVWKIYKEAFNIEIGEIERFSDFDLSNEIVKQKVRERYPNENIPANEKVITPDRMFKAQNLITIKKL